MSTIKTNAEMLVSTKQANLKAREKKAIRFGFSSAAQFIAYLEEAIRSGKRNLPFVAPSTSSASTSTPKSSTPKPTKATPAKTVATVAAIAAVIHVVDIADASGSMSGAKLTASIKGINLGIKQLKEDKTPVSYTYTLCDFSDDVVFKHITERLNRVTEFKTSSRGSTALLDAIGYSIYKVKETLKAGEKVLVNIYTDGEENSSYKFSRTEIGKAIEELSTQGWTFTFIGTARDVKTAQDLLKFDSSNTLVYDGTATGLERSFVTNNVARTQYSSRVSKGEDVSKGFFKDIK